MFTKIVVAVVALMHTASAQIPSSQPGAESDLKRVEYVDMYRGRYRLSFQSWGGAPKESKPLSVEWTGTQGDIKLTYTTQMMSSKTSKGFDKYQGVVKGSFAITDKTGLKLTSSNQLRVCMEFGTKDKVSTYREQVRFVKETSDSTSWEEPEIAKKFDSINADKPYGFCTVPHDDPNIQNTATGYKITGGEFDKSTMTGELKFERPFTTGVTNSLALRSGETYTIFIMWGIYDDKTGRTSQRIYGPKTVAEGKDWTIQKPPSNSFLSAISLSAPIMMMASLMAVTLN